MALTIPELKIHHATIALGLQNYFKAIGWEGGLQHPNNPVNTAKDLAQLYTASAGYLIYTTIFHASQDLQSFMVRVSRLDFETVIDLGCASGYTGLIWALEGKRVRFMDYEGLGLGFVKHFAHEHGLEVEVVPYGSEVGLAPVDLLCSFDVLEHTSNHLHFIDWASAMTRQVAMCWPLVQDVPPPYMPVLDGKVYDDSVKAHLRNRYTIEQEYIEASRSFVIWQTT